jgi:syntenin-1
VHSTNRKQSENVSVSIVGRHEGGQGVAPRAPPSSHAQVPPYPVQSSLNYIPASGQAVYPHLNDYMGLDLTSAELALLYQQETDIRALQVQQERAMQPIGSSGSVQMVAPISGNSIGLRRAAVTHGVREVTICKDQQNRIGMRVKAMHGGIFIVLVTDKSPAALAGLRFGDQLLQIDEQDVAGCSMDQVHKRLRQANANRITIVVRDRPFERTVTLHKDEGGVAGFVVRNGKVESVVAGSSAARNGLLTEHHVVEVNGTNVVGFTDRNISDLIRTSDSVVTLTLMPSRVFEHMMERMAFSLVKRLMDHGTHDI